MSKAAIYLRSSKDRSDVSIISQRRELEKLAKDKGLQITHEYKDVVESGKNTHRPGFSQMLEALKSPIRPWNTLLLVDTSRLSRRRYAAQVFKHECKKRGVDIFYSKMPDVDPITSVILESVFEAMDEVHSLMSREKGLAGMAENIDQGYRAGGRAPRGYKLKHIATGAIRDGAPVLKSVLEPGKDAQLIKKYLEGRAKGYARNKLIKEIGLKISKGSLVDLEWSALTYAGHTIWNMRNEYKRGEGYTGPKRKPRKEWVIKENTHPALITQQEAEAILSRLESKAERFRPSTRYMLCGLLRAPDGTAWHSDGKGNYRLNKKKTYAVIAVEEIDAHIIQQIIADLSSGDFVKRLSKQMSRYVNQHKDDPAKDLRRELLSIDQRIQKYLRFAQDLEDPAPALREVEVLERERKRLDSDISAVERDHQLAKAMAMVTPGQIREALRVFVEEVRQTDKSTLGDVLRSLIRQVILDPKTLTCQVEYHTWREQMASPRLSQLFPQMAV